MKKILLVEKIPDKIVEWGNQESFNKGVNCYITVLMIKVEKGGTKGTYPSNWGNDKNLL